MSKINKGSVASAREAKLLILKSNLLMLEKSREILKHSFTSCQKIKTKADYSLAELDAFEALCARFARSADLITQKILPSVFSVLQESPKTFLDRINLAAKLELVSDVEQIKDIREIRNTIAHEYTLDDIAEHFSQVLQHTDYLLNIIGVLATKIKTILN